MKSVEIYTDGACSGNPGKGGWAAVLFYCDNKLEIRGGELLTTNNRMELKAAIEGLGRLKEDCCVKLYSDSAYLVNAFNLDWISGWNKRGWNKVKNIDLWQEIIALTQKHRVTFVKVKGHSDNVYNNRCDELARQAISEL